MPTKPVPLRAVTCDLWYTLIYTRPPDQHRLTHRREALWIRGMREAGSSASEARATMQGLNAWNQTEEARGRAPSIAAQARWVSRRIGGRVDGAAMGAAIDARAARAPVRVAPGARASLERLRRGGLPLAIVSNLLHGTSAGARAMLDHLGLAKEFSVFFFSDEHPWSKPGPEPFRWAARQLGARPSEVVHVGDLVYDIEGPARAGMRAILYTGLHRLEPPQLIALAQSAPTTVPRAPTWDAVRALVQAAQRLRSTGPSAGRAATRSRSARARRR